MSFKGMYADFAWACRAGVSFSLWASPTVKFNEGTRHRGDVLAVFDNAPVKVGDDKTFLNVLLTTVHMVGIARDKDPERMTLRMQGWRINEWVSWGSRGSKHFWLSNGDIATAYYPSAEAAWQGLIDSRVKL